MRSWINDFIGGDEGRAYLVKVTEGTEVRGWLHADFSGLLNLLHTVDWDNAYGEGATTLDVFLLAPEAVLPCVVTKKAGRNACTDVVITYRNPGKRGRAAVSTADMGSYASVEA